MTYSKLLLTHHRKWVKGGNDIFEVPHGQVFLVDKRDVSVIYINPPDVGPHLLEVRFYSFAFSLYLTPVSAIEEVQLDAKRVFSQSVRPSCFIQPHG